jgi:catechol 2,3-dioxygenase-like lactoylglutathione lyase family enzyme
MIAETKNAANVRQAVPFFWVRDLERCLRFYVDGLGFTMTKRWLDGGKVRWCWLEFGDAAVMLQEFWADGPHRNLPDGQVGLGVTICFICKDAVALWRDFVARGLAAKRPFVGNGMWVTELSDPDGYHLLFESPTDAPDETILPVPDHDDIS